MDNTGQVFSGGMINSDRTFIFTGERIYRFVMNRIEYDRFGPIRNFIGGILVGNKTMYIAELENFPSTTFCLHDFDFLGVENINKYHCFDSLGKYVMLDLTQLDLSDLQIIAVDASSKCNPFTRAEDKSCGDLLFMMSYSTLKNMTRKEYFIFPVNIQRVKMSCMCKGSEAGWNNFLAKFSKEFRTAFFDTLQTDQSRRLWRTNKNFKMYVESFQEVM